MLLTSFGYRDKYEKWELEKVSPLGQSCLLVGKNAAGKTKTIQAIRNVSAFIQSNDKALLDSKTFSADMEFTDVKNPGWKLSYRFSTNEGLIDKEELVLNGNVLIRRTSRISKYCDTIINPPKEKLIVQVRRDRELYPEIEQLMTWAEGVLCLSCSDINPYTVLWTPRLMSPISFSELVDSLTKSDIKMVLGHAANLGYDITSIETFKAKEDFKFVKIKEKNIINTLFDMQLSNGMLRTLYLLCFLEFSKHSSEPSLLLIDDMSEGLDYYKSTHLAKLVFDSCRDNGLQIIASSNDSFLMDVVDISNWQVLRRNRSKVSSINQSNSRDLFDKFRMTGLSNFDLFSSDFIEKYLVKQNS